MISIENNTSQTFFLKIIYYYSYSIYIIICAISYLIIYISNLITDDDNESNGKRSLSVLLYWEKKTKLLEILKQTNIVHTIMRKGWLSI